MNFSENSNLRTIQIITLAMTGSLLILPFILYNNFSNDAGSQTTESIINILLAIATIFITVSVPLRNIVLKFLISKKREMRDNESLLGKFFIAQIITLATREVGVILTFVISTMTGNLNYTLYSVIVVVVLNIISWPNSRSLLK